MKLVYKGFINIKDKGEAYDILFINDDEYPLVETLAEDKEKYGSFATVRYFISNKEKNIYDLNENLIKKISGSVDADYGDRYSEYTGYLWTDQDFNIGGHDLVEELLESNNKYLYLEVDWNKESK